MDSEARTQGEGHVKVKAEIRVMYLPAKERQKLPAKHQKPGAGRQGIDSPSQLAAEPTLLTLGLRPWPPGLWDSTFPLFTTLSLWCVITAATGS